MSRLEHFSMGTQQLDLFKPAGDLVDPEKVTPGDFLPNQPEGWDQKRAENSIALRSGDPDAIKPGDAIHTPVKLKDWGSGKSTIMDGHHRVAVAAAHDPKSLVPVHHDDMDSTAWATRARRAEQNRSILQSNIRMYVANRSPQRE